MAPHPDAIEHLKIARRLHFQNQTEDAIREYMLVLELDPENDDARSGLRALGIEPPEYDEMRPSAVPGLKTDFFAKQAQESHTPAWKRGPVQLIIALAVALAGFGVYNIGYTIINWDNIQAANAIGIEFKRPTQKDNKATISVAVANMNPTKVKNIELAFKVYDEKGNEIKEGRIKLPDTIPAGESRTISDVSLGAIEGKAAKLSGVQIVSVQSGPKPKLTDTQVEKFKTAASKPDREALEDYKDLAESADNFAPAFVGLGRACAARSNWDAAIEQYKRAIQIDPESPSAHMYYAIALFYKGDKQTAKTEITKAYELNPDDPEVKRNYEYVLRDATKSADAE